MEDISSLIAKRREMQEKLKSSDSKIEELKKIIAKKSLNRADTPPEDSTFTKLNLPVSSFVIPKKSIKVIPKILVKSTKILPVETHSNKFVAKLREKLLIEQQVKQMTKSNNIHSGNNLSVGNFTKALKTKEHVKIPESLLPNRYIRGELPCTLEHGPSEQYLSWIAPFESLDYDYYLPVFFDGLQINEHPYKIIARQGCMDLLSAVRGSPERILPSLRYLIQPLRNALAKNNDEITIATMKILQCMLLNNPTLGEALIPHGKHFLTQLVSFFDKTRNIGDSIDYRQRMRDDVGEEIRKTLELLEQCGGSNALACIKFSIPTYESCLRRPDVHHIKDTLKDLPPAVFSKIPKQREKLWH